MGPRGGRRGGGTGSGGAPFVYDPEQEAGYLLDLFADKGNAAGTSTPTVTGAGVSSWIDQAGALDFVQATDAMRPPLVASWSGGRAAVDFQNGDFVRVAIAADALLAAGTDFTVYMIGELDSLNGAAVDNVVLEFSDGYMMLLLETTSPFDVGWYDGSYKPTGQATIGKHVWCWACDSGAASGSTVYEDNVSLGTATVTANGIGGNLTVGCEGTPSTFLDGKIGRLLIFSGLHSAAARARIQAWAESYYGI